MQRALLLAAAFQLCLGYTVDPKTNTHAISYPELRRIADPNVSQSRRRPLLTDSFKPPTVDLTRIPSWPNSTLSLGQVAAVTVDQHNQVIIFHRGNHVWNGQTFNINDEYLKKEDGPISEDPVIALHPSSGTILKSWGKSLFFLPHGLTTDYEDNLWVTDVALHQVFKFPPLSKLSDSSVKPLLTLGERFIPGKDDEHFCKPSAVAVLPNGDFFVSDGYCNYRIIKYSREGHLLLSWGRSTFSGFHSGGPNLTPYQLNVPHALTLAEDRDLVCVADRENGRILCFFSSNGTYAYEIPSNVLGSRVFSVTYSSLKGGLFYIVNGPDGTTPVKGFVVDANTLKVLSIFPSDTTNLSNPHDIAVSPDGECVYVAQLDPHRVLKFMNKGAVVSNQLYNTESENHDASSPTSTITPQYLSSLKSEQNNTGSVSSDVNLMAHSAFSKAISIPLWAMITISIIVTCLVGFGVGCYVRAHRRAYPTVPSEGFKLGQLLDPRDRRGFEQVSTEESDDDRMDADLPA